MCENKRESRAGLSLKNLCALVDNETSFWSKPTSCPWQAAKCLANESPRMKLQAVKQKLLPKHVIAEIICRPGPMTIVRRSPRHCISVTRDINRKEVLVKVSQFDMFAENYSRPSSEFRSLDHLNLKCSKTLLRKNCRLGSRALLRARKQRRTHRDSLLDQKENGDDRCSSNKSQQSCFLKSLWKHSSLKGQTPEEVPMGDHKVIGNNNSNLEMNKTSPKADEALVDYEDYVDQLGKAERDNFLRVAKDVKLCDPSKFSVYKTPNFEVPCNYKKSEYILQRSVGTNCPIIWRTIETQTSSTKLTKNEINQYIYCPGEERTIETQTSITQMAQNWVTKDHKNRGKYYNNAFADAEYLENNRNMETMEIKKRNESEEINISEQKRKLNGCELEYRKFLITSTKRTQVDCITVSSESTTGFNKEEDGKLNFPNHPKLTKLFSCDKILHNSSDQDSGINHSGNCNQSLPDCNSELKVAKPADDYDKCKLKVGKQEKRFIHLGASSLSQSLFFEDYITTQGVQAENTNINITPSKKCLPKDFAPTNVKTEDNSKVVSNAVPDNVVPRGRPNKNLKRVLANRAYSVVSSNCRQHQIQSEGQYPVRSLGKPDIAVKSMAGGDNNFNCTELNYAQIKVEIKKHRKKTCNEEEIVQKPTNGAAGSLLITGSPTPSNEDIVARGEETKEALLQALKSSVSIIRIKKTVKSSGNSAKVNRTRRPLNVLEAVIRNESQTKNKKQKQVNRVKNEDKCKAVKTPIGSVVEEPVPYISPYKISQQETLAPCSEDSKISRASRRKIEVFTNIPTKTRSRVGFFSKEEFSKMRPVSANNAIKFIEAALAKTQKLNKPVLINFQESPSVRSENEEMLARKRKQSKELHIFPIVTPLNCSRII
uniref:Uncharacterized protein n=1 Tax=Glossina austeni TaxID=7395 RepID=A0A1A9UEP7_GLOAU